MEHAAAAPQSRAPAAVAAILAFGAFVALAAGGAQGSPIFVAGGLALLAAAPVALIRTVSWKVMLGALVLVVVFIPMRRYNFSSGLPIQLEPYRLVVALLFGAWLSCLLVDERIRLRRTGFEGPMLLIFLVAAASVAANWERAAPIQTDVVKTLSFLASFLLVLVLIATVTRTAADVNAVLKTYVVSMTVLGLLALIESRTGASPFGHLGRVLPILQEAGEEGIIRGAGMRARASAEHPIALGAALVLAVPAAMYLARAAKTSRWWWWSCVAALALGTLSTLSRTGVVMLVMVGLVYLWLRPRETVRLWPLLLPFVAVVHMAAPGTLGTLKYAFFPEGGMLAEQAENINDDCDASGRVSDIGPSLEQVSNQPLLGIGYGTRITVGENENACILDNQALGLLLDKGIVGLLAWIWFFARFIRRLGRGAATRTADGELCAALAASIAAYVIGMFTFDTLTFIQVTFMLFMLMGLAASTLMRTSDAERELPRALAPVLRAT